VIGALKIARDISARKLADDQLRAATAKFDSAFSQSGTSAAILDLDGYLLGPVARVKRGDPVEPATEPRQPV
jgi:hypothetical protein